MTAIEEQTTLRFAFKPSILPQNATVSLDARDLTVAAALTQVLLDADVDVEFTPYGLASLVPRAAHGRPSTMQQTGTITGRIIDAKTKRPIAYATVALDETGRAATASDSGIYRFANVAAGTYTVVTRRLGYVVASKSIVVAQDEVTTADFSLEQSANKLDQVVVTGSIVPVEVKALPTPISLISSANIDAQQPEQLSETIRQYVPSAVAWNTPTNPNLTPMSVRGASQLNLGNGSLKVYVDGVEITDVTSAAIDPSSVDHIELLRGPEGSTIYGANALGGVMQVFTKRGDPTQERPRINLDAALGTIQSPYPAHSGALRQDYKASIIGGSNNLSYNLGGGYAHSGAWVQEGESSLPSAYGGLHVEQRTVELDLSGRYYGQQTPSAQNPVLYPIPYYQQNRTEEQTYGAHLTYRATPWWRNTITLGADEYTTDDRQTRPRLTTPADTELFIYQGTEQKLTLAYNTSVEVRATPTLVTTATAGVDGYAYQTAAYYTGGALQTFGPITTDPAFPAAGNRATENDVGFFGQLQVGIHDALFLTAGVRAEFNTSFGQDIGRPVSPRFGASYSLPIGPATIKLRSSYGAAIRPPSPLERYASVTPPYQQLANEHLQPEQQHGWDGGADVTFGAPVSFGVTYYDQSATNLITSGPVDTTRLVYQFQNVGRVRNYGLELEATATVGIVGVHAQYAWTESHVEKLGSLYSGDLRPGDQVYYIPERTGGASISVAPLRTTRVTAGVTYVGQWIGYNTAAELACFNGTAPCPSSFRTFFHKFPEFAKVNLTVSHDVTSTLTAYVTAENLLNRDAIEQTDTNPIQGRVTMFGLRFRY
ncbi:MAG TPA: TonB-dependent receptor [Vicinamibacterales bacterium]|nr:TonB-dependent receptor [Vicinamibacterales bacterium]